MYRVENTAVLLIKFLNQAKFVSMMDSKKWLVLFLQTSKAPGEKYRASGLDSK